MQCNAEIHCKIVLIKTRAKKDEGGSTHDSSRFAVLIVYDQKRLRNYDTTRNSHIAMTMGTRVKKRKKEHIYDIEVHIFCTFIIMRYYWSHPYFFKCLKNNMFNAHDLESDRNNVLSAVKHTFQIIVLLFSNNLSQRFAFL